MFFFLPLKINRRYNSFPWVTLTLIVVNVIVFLGTYSNLEPVVFRFGFYLSARAWYTWFTSLFIHGSLSHLIFNLYFLWIFGSFLEDTIGRLRYCGLYFFGGLVSALTNLIIFRLASPQWVKIPLIGASGAIAALMGLFALRFLYHKIKVAYFIFFFFFIRAGTFELSSLSALLLWFIRELYYGYSQLGGLNSGVANWAHIGGFVFGLVWAKFSRFEIEAKHEHYLDEARALKRQQLEIAALTNYREALKTNPTDLEVMIEMAPLLADTGEQPKARLFYEIAIKKLLEKGERERALRLLVEAREKLEEGNEFDFTIREKYSLACTAESQKNFALAEEFYRELLGCSEVSFREMAYFRLGEMLEKEGREEEAKEVFLAFLRENPQSELSPLVRKKLKNFTK
jgi:membrane associated rhomboid family serine protease